MAAPLSRASDKLTAPNIKKGQETTITVRPDDAAGEFRRQRIEITDNGEVSCGRVELRGAIFAPVIGRINFTTVDFGSCVYLGAQARVNASSCDAVITSNGLGKFVNREGGRCDLRIEAPGCTVHLGKGPFLELGYFNISAPSEPKRLTETTALTEPIRFGGTAIGSGCLSPGPSAVAQYTGYLRLAASRNGVKTPFIVIL